MPNPTPTPTRRPLWIARVAGSQVEMGRQHGRLLAAAGGADPVLDHYQDMPVRLLAGDVRRPWRPLVSAAMRGLSEALLVRLAAARPGDLAARSRAFFEGLGRPPRMSRYLGVMDLFQNYVGLAARWGLGPFAAPARAVMAAAAQPACSTVMAWGAATAGGDLLHARNFDFPGIGVWDAAPALVLCAPDRGQRYGFVTTRGGDTPVVTVWNQAGLVITSHTRFHRQVRFDAASVVDVVHDIARRAETLADAAAIVRERPVASTWGLAVSSARERTGRVFEIHGGAVAEVGPAPGGDHVVCCNRYHDPAMRDGEVALTPAWSRHSERREQRLTARVDEARAAGGAAPLDLAAMLIDREDLDAPGVIRHLGAIVAQPSQVQSVVVAPERGALWLGVGEAPVGEGRWLRVGWDWDGQVGAVELGQPVPAGLGVTVEEAGVLPRSPASDHVARALAAEQRDHDPEVTGEALARAIAAAPADPTLRLAQTWTELRRGRAAQAADHAAAGLEHETLPYPRGQLLLWGARAAALAGQDSRVQLWRAELASLAGTGVDRLQASAARDGARPVKALRRPIAANLSVMEAGWG